MNDKEREQLHDGGFLLLRPIPLAQEAFIFPAPFSSFSLLKSEKNK
jgi:hypothetical protein